jgi:flagellar biosynthesis component FlhA
VADGASSREALPSALAEALSTQLQSLAQKRWRSNKPVVFVVDPEIRRVFFELALQRVADPHVLAFDEIAPEVELVELETISWDAPAPPSSNDILDTRR